MHSHPFIVKCRYDLRMEYQDEIVFGKYRRVGGKSHEFKEDL